MKEDNQMKEEFSRYKATLDASMIVATAKLFFFNELWKEISKQDRVRRLSEKNFEMARRHLRVAVASMDDTMFFFPPDEAPGRVAYERMMKQAFDSGLRKKILAEFNRRVEAEDPTLSKYFQGIA
jgi:hypothetical protein